MSWPQASRLLLLLVHFLFGADAAVIHEPGNPPNQDHQKNKPYVLLVSLDGFRHDYAELYDATNLLALARSGARAESLIPVFPSLTFPSHYSIVTGLRPERHGLVGMRFYDPQTSDFFAYTERRCLTNGHWYGGTPLWVLAEKQGMRSAAYFWVGSEAEIQGVRPSLYAAYDGKIPNEERISTVIQWLRLPEDLRPHFTMLYFSDVDVAGHQFGPESTQTREAVQRVDAAIGVLVRELRTLPFPVNLLIVSDHGMATRQEERTLLYQSADFSGAVAQSNGSHAAIYSKDPERLESIYRQLARSSNRFTVFRRNEVPEHLHYRQNDRIGDLVLIPNGPFLLNVTPPSGALPGGMHGYDPAKYAEMNGIFLAAGPNITAGLKTKPIESIHIYLLISRILSLTPPSDLDGNFDAIKDFYRSP